MKLTKSLLIVTLACGTLWAQAPADQNAKPPAKTPPPASKNATPAKPATTPAKPGTPAPATTAKGTAPATSAKTPAKPAIATQSAAKPAAVPAKPVAKTAVVPAKPATQTVAVPAKPATKTAAVPAKPVAKAAVVPMKPVAKTPPPKTMAKAPFEPKKPMPTKVAPVAVKKSTTPEVVGATKPASVKEEASATRVGRMRDPFVSPIVRTGGVGAGCDTGKRCLVVDQIVLKGIVKSQAGFIAVVENPAKRAYFMRENDPVFNGKVTKITGDTVVFQEQVTDKLGKQSSREVVKKVNAPIV